MQEVFQQIIGLLRGIWHRRWIGLATAWIAAIVGVALVYRIPERYEATARVYVHRLRKRLERIMRLHFEIVSSQAGWWFINSNKRKNSSIR